MVVRDGARGGASHDGVAADLFATGSSQIWCCNGIGIYVTKVVVSGFVLMLTILLFLPPLSVLMCLLLFCDFIINLA